MIVLIAAAIFGIGFYLGWFRLSTDHAAVNPSYTVTVDKDKITEDKDKAVDKLQDVEHKVAAKIAPATQP
jgi:hypothetical protein